MAEKTVSPVQRDAVKFDQIRECKSDFYAFLQAVSLAGARNLNYIKAAILKSAGIRPIVDPDAPKGSGTLAYEYDYLGGITCKVFVTNTIGLNLSSDIYDVDDPNLTWKLKGSRELMEKIVAALDGMPSAGLLRKGEVGERQKAHGPEFTCRY